MCLSCHLVRNWIHRCQHLVHEHVSADTRTRELPIRHNPNTHDNALTSDLYCPRLPPTLSIRRPRKLTSQSVSFPKHPLHSCRPGLSLPPTSATPQSIALLNKPKNSQSARFPRTSCTTTTRQLHIMHTTHLPLPAFLSSYQYIDDVRNPETKTHALAASVHS